MEKIMVVAGIWTMCALCAVLFIRGASTRETRRVKLVEDARHDAADGAA